jgi:two-component system CheB/CheR fusion protein
MRIRAQDLRRSLSGMRSSTPDRPLARKVRKAESGKRTGHRREPFFPIVGIGASAGGLEAFTQLLKHLPHDTGMAFILVQHLDPTHESELTQLLAKATSMPTREVTDKLRVEPNHVYVIPPNTTMAIARGVLKLEPRSEGRRPQHAIDFFLESLAQDRHASAIGVILSGTATDGTLGLEAIKAEGGITFAQDDTARYDSMPRSAVAAGCVDAVLPPEGIATELARLAKHPYVVNGNAEPGLRGMDHGSIASPSGARRAPAAGAASAATQPAQGAGRAADEGFRTILELLHAHCGVDFSLYKPSTIRRRIARRMVLSHNETLAGYAKFLRSNAKELETLFSDVLISVTSFFRNPEAFDALKKLVFPAIAQQRDEPMRAWVLGCSTGQEAYSIAMAYVEYCDAAHRAPRLQVFATDLNEALLGKARAGLYSRTVVNDVSPERLRRFFVEEDGGYRIAKSLREMVVFARQNLSTDPPFSRMNLVSCRNVLIYLEPDLQQKALAMFHYALKPGGFLLLGASESAGAFASLFEVVDKKHKIFSRKPVASPAHQWPAGRAAPKRDGARRAAIQGPMAPQAASSTSVAEREADRLMLGVFVPPGVLVNDEMQIVQFRGATTPYLVPPTGKATFDVLKMSREGLALPLRAALGKARKENKPVRRAGVRIGQDGDMRTVDIEVIPLRSQHERYFLILFERPGGAAATKRAARESEASVPTGTIRAETAGAKALRQRLAQTERALAESREYLESVQQQFESANEELQASTEELQSSNEELQSMNEELETSKEELESTNEELTTVNEELGYRNAELDRINADLRNVLTSTRTPILVVGRDLAIRRFTPQAEKFFSLLATDVGRPLRGVRHTLVFQPEGAAANRRLATQPVELEGFLQDVIDNAAAREREVRDELGRWYSLRATPYLSFDNKIDGAVLMLVDVDALKRSEREAQSAREFSEATIRTMRDPLLVLDADLRVTMANEAFYRTFRIRQDEVEGRSIYALGNGQWDIPRLRGLLEEILPRNSFFNDFEVIQEFPSIGRRTILLNARRLSLGGGTGLILLAFEDVTERLESREALRASELRYRRLFEASQEGIVLLDMVTRKITDANSCAEELLGEERKELLDKELWQVGLLESEQHSHAVFRKLQKEGTFRIDELELEAPDGQRRWLELFASLYAEKESNVIQLRIREVGERKRSQDALREAERRLRFVLDAMPQKVFTAKPTGDLDYLNQQWIQYSGCTAEELAGSGVLRTVHPSDVDASRGAWQHSMETGEPFLAMQRLRRSDGEYRWHSSRAVPMRDASGSFLLWVGSATDIHDIVEQSRHKDEFMATLAHELRNPLAPMRNVVEILKRANGNAELILKARETLERQLSHLVRLVDDLLDADRIGRGVLELRLEEVELSTVIDHAVEACRPAIDRGRHELKVTLPERPIWLRADPVRLAQVFGNLVDNAAKYSKPAGHIAIDAELQGESVLVTVRDAGIGIPPDMLLKVFDMFAQVDRSSDSAHSGLGIGLALVKRLVEMHGGTIEAKSDGRGRGSEFVVRLPALLKDSEASAAGGARVQEPS